MHIDSFVICNLPPDDTPPHIDGATATAIQTSASTLEATWGGFADPESNVKNYSICIGSTPGASDIVGCAPIGEDKGFTFENANFTTWDGVTAYVHVAGANGEGLESSISIPFEVDDSPPAVTDFKLYREWDDRYVDEPVVKQSDTTAVRFQLLVEEPNSAPNVFTKIVEVALGAGPGSYQSAHQWTEVLQDWSDNPQLATVVFSGLQLQHGAYYYVHVRTTSSIGRQGLFTAASRVYIDTTPPVPEYVSVHDGASVVLEYVADFLPLSAGRPDVSATSWLVAPMWNFTDNESEFLNFTVQLLDADGDSDQPVVEQTVGPDTTSTVFRDLDLPHGFRYQVRVAGSTNASLSSEITSEAVLIDRTRPELRQALDLGPNVTTGPLADVPVHPKFINGFYAPEMLTPGAASVMDLDFVTELSELRVGFGAWDLESGILQFSIAAGTAPGGTSVVPWTVLPFDGTRQATVPLPAGLELAPHQRYYVSVATVNVCASSLLLAACRLLLAACCLLPAA